MATGDTVVAAPPGLRESIREDRECGNCAFFDHTHCTKFPPLCVSDEWVCDAWKAGGKDVDEQPASTAKTVRQAGKDAIARIRAG